MEELVTEHQVHDVQLAHRQQGAQGLEGKQAEGAGVVPAGVGGQEGCEPRHLLSQGHLGQRILADLLHQLLHPAALSLLPQRPGEVADTGLQHQHQTHPLVVVVVLGAFLRATGAILK